MMVSVNHIDHMLNELVIAFKMEHKAMQNIFCNKPDKKAQKRMPEKRPE
ncbi:hypothetical protein PT277_00015 [Acetobacteraceae bacterium ESL0709]|nr:hypothetical protein [Acetobacteraceae bacterium ESL0709]